MVDLGKFVSPGKTSLCSGSMPTRAPSPCTTTPPPTDIRSQPPPRTFPTTCCSTFAFWGGQFMRIQHDQIPRFCWSVHPDGPCALASACTGSLSLGNLFSHIPWPIIGQGSRGLARWAEIVFLCNRVAKIPLITLTAVSRTPASNPMFAQKCSRTVFFSQQTSQPSRMLRGWCSQQPGQRL